MIITNVVQWFAANVPREVILGSVISGLALLFATVLGLIFFAPTQYDPYTTDLINELAEGRGKHDNDSGKNSKVGSNRSMGRAKLPASTTVVVLGDVGRSPRMQYHAISLVENGAFVNLVGYFESEAHPSLQNKPNLKAVPMKRVPGFLSNSNFITFLVLGPLKVIWQAITLAFALGYSTRPTRFMLVQTPPSIPTLVVAKLACFMRNTILVIDWHNFGWSILEKKLMEGHPFAIASKLYEITMANMAHRRFTVSKAMANWLQKMTKIEALTLYDRPANEFKPIEAADRAEVLKKLDMPEDKAAELMSGTTRLLVSSTSWTEDEDFGLLLDALIAYSAAAKEDKRLPGILLMITGKGPQQKTYLERVAYFDKRGKLNKIGIVTAWLAFSDYASLLSAADLGVSLHKSASGLDLPMKVVDMFGAGLPVVGYSDYESWSELVTEGVNGKGFTNSEELTKLLIELFTNSGALGTLREGALEQSKRRWEDEWMDVAGKKVFFPQLAVDG